MDNFYVYMYLRYLPSKNGKAGSPYYIGKGHGTRVLSRNRRCRIPINLSRVVYFATDMSEPDAHQLEMLLIYRFGRIDNHTGCLANLTDGGEGFRGGKHTPERNKRMSEWMKANPNRGNKVCPKWPQGKPRAAETKLKQSIAMKGRTPPNKGVPQTPEQIEKNRLAHLGLTHSEETRNKMRAAHSGRKHSPERIAAMVAAKAASRLLKTN